MCWAVNSTSLAIKVFTFLDLQIKKTKLHLENKSVAFVVKPNIQNKISKVKVTINNQKNAKSEKLKCHLYGREKHFINNCSKFKNL